MSIIDKVKSPFEPESELNRVKDFLGKIKEIKEIHKQSVITLKDSVPEDSFKFICYREDGLYFSAVFEIIDSDYYLVIRHSKDFRIYSRHEFNPLSDNKKHLASFALKGISLEEALNLVPKKAGVFLCFHIDVIK